VKAPPGYDKMVLTFEVREHRRQVRHAFLMGIAVGVLSGCAVLLALAYVH
jgi:hypothetical protein